MCVCVRAYSTWFSLFFFRRKDMRDHTLRLFFCKVHQDISLVWTRWGWGTFGTNAITKGMEKTVRDGMMEYNEVGQGGESGLDWVSDIMKSALFIC